MLGSAAESDFAGEMEIFVRSDTAHDYVLQAHGENTAHDVLAAIIGGDRAGQPKWRLYFDDLELEKQKTLAGYGIRPGSALHLVCTPRVLAYADDPTAESGSSARTNGDGEMRIFVQSEYHGNYALEVDSSNTIGDVLVTVLPISRVEAMPKPTLSFNGHQLEAAKSLADYSIQDGFVLHLECANWVTRGLTVVRESPNVISKKKRIMITNQSLTIWEKEHDKVLLGLLVEQIRNGAREILYSGKDSWCDIVTRFNESTGLNYEYKHLYLRFNFYKREYRIVNNIRHHPKFSWDHQRQVVIATDAEWNEYIKAYPDARPYRRRAVPYIDLMEILFADKEG